MWNAGLDEAQAEIKIAGRNVNNLRYADDTTLWQKVKRNLKPLDESERGEWKSCLKLNIQKTKMMNLVSSLHGKKVKRTFLGEKDLEGPVGLHRTIQLELLQHYCLGHRFGLLWYWMICLGNEQGSFCRFLRLRPSTSFLTLFWLWWLLHFF